MSNSLKSFAFAITLVWAMFLAGCIVVNSQSANFKETRDLSVAHQAGSALRVNTQNGSVTIKRQAGPDVRIAAMLKCISQQRLTDSQVVAQRGPDGALKIEVAWAGGKPEDNEGCNFDIAIPEAKGVDVATSNGAVTITGLTGAATVRTSNGAIRLTDHDGAVDAATSNGRIDLGNVTGQQKVSTSNGAIEIEGAKSVVWASTSNGRVIVRCAPDGTGPVQLRSSNGEIRLTLGSAFAGKLNASTSNGRIDLPNLTSARDISVSTNSASFAMGRSNDVSEIHTSNGAISVQMAK